MLLFVRVEVFIGRLKVITAGSVGETSRRDASIFGKMETMEGGAISIVCCVVKDHA